jgi:hypothetical protein
MAQVDPFLVPVPKKLANDPELAPYFNYLNKFLHDLFLRTGGGEDIIDADKTTTNEIILAVNELVDDHETFRLAASSSNTLTDELRTDHDDFVTLTSELKADFNSQATQLNNLLTKLDNDAGVNDTDYASSITIPTIAASDVSAITAPEASDPPDVLTNSDDIDSL